MPDPGTLLAAVGLGVGRGSPLLRDVTFAVAPGQWWFVLGRNGAGKTTLVQTLLGVLPALGGSIARAPRVADRSGLGYVPQEVRPPAALPLTAREFVDLGLADLRRSPADRRARTQRALAALRVEDLAAAPFDRLSLGQRRRVLVARALAREPELLVLDEPTASLDPPLADALCADLEGLRRTTGMALLHVTHDLDLTRHHATHVVLVRAGRVQAGPAESFADLRVALAEEPVA